MRRPSSPNLAARAKQALSLIYRNRVLLLVEHHEEYSLDVALELLEEQRRDNTLTIALLSTRPFEENEVPSNLSVRTLKLPFLAPVRLIRVKHLYDLPEVL